MSLDEKPTAYGAAAFCFIAGFFWFAMWYLEFEWISFSDGILPISDEFWLSMFSFCAGIVIMVLKATGLLYFIGARDKNGELLTLDNDGSDEAKDKTPQD